MSSPSAAPTQPPSPLINPWTPVGAYWSFMTLNFCWIALMSPLFLYYIIGCLLRPCVIFPLCEYKRGKRPCESNEGGQGRESGGLCNAQSSSASIQTCGTPGACGIFIMFTVIIVLLATVPLWAPWTCLALAISLNTNDSHSEVRIVIATITIVLIFVVAIPLVLITAWAPWICEGHKTRYLWEDDKHKLKREREETGMTWAQQRRLMAGLPASVAVPAGLVNTDPTDGVDTSSPIGRKSAVRRVSVTLSPLVVAEQRRSLAVSQAESIAANWKQFSQQDEKKQHHCYWANTVTHKTTWSKPECLVEAEKEEMVFNAPTSTSLNDPSSSILKTKQNNKKSSASAVANPVAALARGKAAPIAPPPGRRSRQKEKKLPGTIQLGHIAAASVRVSVKIQGPSLAPPGPPSLHQTAAGPPSSSSTLATQAALFEQMVHAYGSLEQERMVVEIRADPQHFLGDPRPLIQTIARHFAAGTSPLPASGTLENCGSFAAVHALPTSEVVDGLIATVREEGGAGEGEQRQERQRPRVRGPSSIV